jgi:hypothetical protein
MALGLDRKQATELEQALLKSQRTLLEAAGQNLKRQREYLARLKERLHTFSGSP